MKFYTSYFYKLRFFTPNMLPFSTAKWDPKWYHNFQSQTYTFIDKRGIINGLRADPFVLKDGIFENLPAEEQCCKDCLQKQYVPNCAFMNEYRKQLSKLNPTIIMNKFEQFGQRLKQDLNFDEEPIIVLLVHEPISCNCAERPVIQEWFKNNNIPIKEWDQ